MKTNSLLTNWFSNKQRRTKANSKRELTLCLMRKVETFLCSSRRIGSNRIWKWISMEWRGRIFRPSARSMEFRPISPTVIWPIVSLLCSRFSSSSSPSNSILPVSFFCSCLFPEKLDRNYHLFRGKNCLLKIVTF